MNSRRRGLRGMRVLAFALAAMAAGCASPPLAVYTLGVPGAVADVAPLQGEATVIELRRVAVPDFLDTQDIVLRRGNTLDRSAQGRWASRVSVGLTQFLAGKLAARRPDALVTDQPQADPPNWRIFVTVSTLDVSADGTGTLVADWMIVPRNPAQAPRRERRGFGATGPVATDQDVVRLNTALAEQLAAAIDVTDLR